MELCPCHTAILRASDRSRKGSIRRCCTYVCMQYFASNHAENILNGMCDYKKYNLITSTQNFFLSLSHKRAPASMLAVILTGVLATLYVCFGTRLFYAYRLSNTMQVVAELFEVALPPKSRCPFQYQLGTGLTSSPRSLCCGWLPRQSACTASTSAGIDGEGRKPASLDCYDYW